MTMITINNIILGDAYDGVREDGSCRGAGIQNKSSLVGIIHIFQNTNTNTKEIQFDFWKLT